MKVTEKLKSTILKASTIPVLAFCAFTPAMAQGIYALKQVNTPYDEQQPVISSKEELFLSVAFHPENTGGSKDFGDVWYSKKNDFNQWEAPRAVRSLSTAGYDLLIGFPDGERALVYHDGKNKPHGIHQYRRTGETDWQYEKQLDFGSFRNNGKSFSARLHPSGDILLMSMNSYGTYGNEDIYVSFKQSNGSWSVPKNIGADVNTFEQEMTPFISDDKQVIYFSTNGHGTTEGRDIYYAQRLDDSWEKWTKPKRLKDDINSRGVELSYFIDPNSPYTAFVTTTQNSEGYGDILMQRKEEIVLEELSPEEINPKPYLAANFVRNSSAVDNAAQVPEENKANEVMIREELINTPADVDHKPETIAIPVQQEVVSEKTEQEKALEQEKTIAYAASEPQEDKMETPAAIISNEEYVLKVLDKKSKETIPYKVVFKDENGNPLGVENSLTAVDKFALRKGTVKLTISSPNYLPASLDLQVLEDGEETVWLTSAVKGVSLVLEEVLFQKGTSELADENSLKYIDQLVDFLNENPGLKVRLEGHTDNVGNVRLNKELSMDRAATIRDVMVDKGVDFERIRLRGYGGAKPIADNDSPSGREQNRRVEMVIID
ncbi:OmpA family protein [Echinicola marina]|uniref:OmpA family protein n=1 Tax=Echinicola marina TaxID=2859768 RepID=UPI001CF6B809|nr:OmpA family protein [Echinicola marina]UCS92685.1 OmpA family protein [Echinicola marina]